jgi:hypothetical protein
MELIYKIRNKVVNIVVEWRTEEFIEEVYVIEKI